MHAVVLIAKVIVYSFRLTYAVDIEWMSLPEPMLEL
jgi:hypothetical protein